MIGEVDSTPCGEAGCYVCESLNPSFATHFPTWYVAYRQSSYDDVWRAHSLLLFTAQLSLAKNWTSRAS